MKRTVGITIAGITITDCHGFYPPYLFENGDMITVDGNTRMDHGS